jgi:hypothetical protein
MPLPDISLFYLVIRDFAKQFWFHEFWNYNPGIIEAENG